MPLLTVIIKALNEERRIGACLQAVLASVQGLDAEVVLVDSLSTDGTVAQARRHPVRIVQFDRAADRSCGAAVELGWRHARGEFIYLLDADMLLQPGFPARALAWLLAHPQVAAVGGGLIDTQARTLADQQRLRVAAAQTAPRDVDELGGGGLYRRSAVEQAGYLGHRSLAAYEEAELGVRLRALGWRLVRLPEVAVLHEGHAETNWQMLARLWRNGRAKSGAVFLKSAWGRPWFTLVLRKLWHILAVPCIHAVALVCAAVAAWAAAAGGDAAALRAGLLAWSACWAALVGVLAWRRRSLLQGLWQVALWHYWAAGTLAGLGQRVGDPKAPIAARELAAVGIIA